jgi:hypothetical protein
VSLYDEQEICGGCRFATFHSCGNCLKYCGANASEDKNHVTGKCLSRQASIDESDGLGWDDMREPPASNDKPHPGRPYMEDG